MVVATMLVACSNTTWPAMSSSEERETPRRFRKDKSDKAKEKAEADAPLLAAAATSAASQGVGRERLVVTVHRGAALPAMDSDGMSDPYAVVRLGKALRRETKCVRSTLNPVFEETFVFPLTSAARKHEKLVVDLYDRDWVLGIPLKPDYMGCVEMALENVPATGIVQQWFPLRNSDGMLYEEARVQLSVSVTFIDELEGEQSFWDLLSAEQVKEEKIGVVGRVVGRIKGTNNAADAGGTVASEKSATVGGGTQAPGAIAGVALATEEEAQVLRVLVPLVRPVVNNILRALYVVVRPVMLFLLWHRTILLDWEKPGMALLFSLLFFWSWLHELQLALLLAYLFGWAFLQVLKRRMASIQADSEQPPRLSMAEMVEAYKRTKADLTYSELDPLASDLAALEVFTRRLCDNVQLYHDNLLVYGDRRVVGVTLGVLGSGAAMCTLFSPIIGWLGYIAVRYTVLLTYIRYVVLMPIHWRYPELFPTVFTFVLKPFRRPIRAARMWLQKRTQLRELTRAEEWDDATKAMRSKYHMTMADWEMLARDVGSKVRLRKGQVLEQPGIIGHHVYRLDRGKVELRGPQLAMASLLLNAPCQLFSANVLVGHGIITHTVTATVNCKLLAFDVIDLRRLFQTEPVVGEKFFLDLALELALELKLLQERFRQRHKALADAASSGTPAPAAVDSDPSVVVSMSTPTVTGMSPDPSTSASVSAPGVVVVGADAEDRVPTPPGDVLVPMALSQMSPVTSATAPAPVPVAAPVPMTSPGRAVDPLHKTADLFSMSIQSLPTVEEASEKLWVFFQETFNTQVKREALKVFDRNVWTKKGWTRFPGRLFVTPVHIAFWSQAGKKTVLGSATRGASTESWIIPLSAITAFSLHERKQHLKFTYDATRPEFAALEQHSVVVLPSQKLKHGKPPTVKVYSDDVQQLIEVRRTVELALASRNLVAGAAAAQVECHTSTPSVCEDTLLTPNLGGVELTAGTIRPEELMQASEANPLSIMVEATKKTVKGGIHFGAHMLQRGARAFGVHPNDNSNNAPEGTEHGRESAGLASAREILALRANVLDYEDRAHLVGQSVEESDKTLLVFAAGEVAFKRGMRYERAIYQVVKGECAAEEEGGSVLARFRVGEIFGEVSFLLHEPTRVAIRAVTPLEIRVLTATRLEEKFKQFPGLGARFYEFLCYHEISFMNNVIVHDARRAAAQMAELVAAEEALLPMPLVAPMTTPTPAAATTPRSANKPTRR